MWKMLNSTILIFLAAFRMIAEGHRMVAQGWTLFKEAIESAGPGDLQQILCHLKGVTMPTPPPVPAPGPVQMDVPQQ